MSSVPYASPATPAARPRFAKSAVASFICGLLLCVPLLSGLLALLLGVVGFIGAGKPGMKGRWMAVIGILLGLANIGGWAIAGSGMVAAWRIGSSMVSTMTAPSYATHDFLAALARGDDVEAKKHCSMSDADYATAKAMVQAQGDFIDTTFNNISINEGDTGKGHVSGTALFKIRTLNVNADLSDGPEGWRVTSIELLP